MTLEEMQNEAEEMSELISFDEATVEEKESEYEYESPEPSVSHEVPQPTTRQTFEEIYAEAMKELNTPLEAEMKTTEGNQ